MNLFSQKSVTSLSIDKNHYFLNDPTTPELKSKFLIPKHPKYMPFNIRNFDPREYSLIRENDYKNLNCYFTICNLLNYFQSTLTSIEGKNIKYWFNNKPLKINPFAGAGLNAYYDRESLIFLYKNSFFKKRVVYTCDSVDIVSHELGHAILDSLRPDFWNMQSLEIWSFHEAFADINAFINVSNSDFIIEKTFEETNQNLKKSNVLSRIGEDLASSILPNKTCLRDLTDDLNYIDPKNINSNSKITKNPHDFGRIFSSCWYAIFVEIFNFEINNGVEPLLAFKSAKNECYSCLIKTVKMAPCQQNFFNVFSKIFILNMNGKYKDLTESILEKRKLIKKEIKYLSTNPNSKSIINGNNNIVFNNNNDLFVLKKYVKNESVNALSLSSEVEMEIPLDSFFHINNNQIIEEFIPDENESLDAALFCKSYIEETNSNNWKIENNFLNRVLID